jgi:ribosome biogenesis GTPase
MQERSQNLWQRQQNKRALAKKERAKMKHFASPSHEHVEDVDANDAHIKTSKVGVVAARLHPGTYSVMFDGAFFNCTLATEAMQLSNDLVIGDNVYIDKESGEVGIIQGKQKRKSVIARLRGDGTRYSPASLSQHIIAANVDHAVIVAAAQDPPFHPRFIDRYLIICQNGNTNPIICLNKCDLTIERHPVLFFYRQLGITIVETSTVTGEGIEALRGAIRGGSAVLVGNSGVGKSSLVNALIPGMELQTREVGEKSGQGKHTTTASNLYRWDEGSYIIDTPGIRSLGIEHIEKNSIRFFFAEFEPFGEKCQYRDCLHDHEPTCEVRLAAERGDLNTYRYESYLRMLHE